MRNWYFFSTNAIVFKPVEEILQKPENSFTNKQIKSSPNYFCWGLPRNTTQLMLQKSLFYTRWHISCSFKSIGEKWFLMLFKSLAVRDFQDALNFFMLGCLPGVWELRLEIFFPKTTVLMEFIFKDVLRPSFKCLQNSNRTAERYHQLPFFYDPKNSLGWLL